MSMTATGPSFAALAAARNPRLESAMQTLQQTAAANGGSLPKEVTRALIDNGFSDVAKMFADRFEKSSGPGPFICGTPQPPPEKPTTSLDLRMGRIDAGSSQDEALAQTAKALLRKLTGEDAGAHIAALDEVPGFLALTMPMGPASERRLNDLKVNLPWQQEEYVATTKSLLRRASDITDRLGAQDPAVQRGAIADASRFLRSADVSLYVERPVLDALLAATTSAGATSTDAGIRSAIHEAEAAPARWAPFPGRPAFMSEQPVDLDAGRSLPPRRAANG